MNPATFKRKQAPRPPAVAELLPDFGGTAKVDAPFRTRPDIGLPNVTLGAGEYYDWYQCCGCGEFVDSKQDPGRWRNMQKAADGSNIPGGVWCAICCRDGKAGVQEVLITGPIESRCPPAYADATFETLKPVVLRNFLAAWPDPMPFVMLQGIPGAGKTRTSWAIEKRWAAKGRRVRYEETSRLRAAWLKAGIDHRTDLEVSLETARFLILDAFSDTIASEGWKDFLLRLLNERWSFQRPTLLTSMHGRAELLTMLGTPIMSRLTQYRWNKLPDKDWREESKEILPESA